MCERRSHTLLYLLKIYLSNDKVENNMEGGIDWITKFCLSSNRPDKTFCKSTCNENPHI